MQAYHGPFVCALAPMDGFTDCVYRAITHETWKQYGDPTTALTTRTEFMNVDGYLRVPQRLVHHLVSVTDYPTPIAQIYGGKKETLVECCHVLCRQYPFFAGIELNIGCPSPSVMQCEAGAGMMKDKRKTLDTIKAMSAACAEYGMNFSIKTRLGLDENDADAQEEFILDAIPFCHMVSVHARTFKQGHSGDVNRARLETIKKTGGEGICLIGNGGISSYTDGREKCAMLDGMMIAQAAIGNPWVLTPHIPSPADRFATMMRHFRLFVGWEIYMQEYRRYTEEKQNYQFPMPSIANLWEKSAIIEQYDGRLLYSCREFRKHCFSYLKTLPESKECKQLLAREENPQTMIKILTDFFEKL